MSSTELKSREFDFALTGATLVFNVRNCTANCSFFQIARENITVVNANSEASKKVLNLGRNDTMWNG